jgi:hypothetical protein
LVLGISLAAFALSLTGVLWGIFVPVGAIFLGLFLNFYVLGKESALFDEEQKLRTALAEKNTPAVQQTSRAKSEGALSRAAAH